MASIRLTGGWVAGAMGGEIVSGAASRVFARVSIDSRAVAPGELFVAIRGERFDGAAFADAALAQGAAGVVVPRGWTPRSTAAGAESGGAALAERPVIIAVDDTTAALQA